MCVILVITGSVSLAIIVIKVAVAIILIVEYDCTIHIIMTAGTVNSLVIIVTGAVTGIVN